MAVDGESEQEMISSRMLMGGNNGTNTQIFLFTCSLIGQQKAKTIQVLLVVLSGPGLYGFGVYGWLASSFF